MKTLSSPWLFLLILLISYHSTPLHAQSAEELELQTQDLIKEEVQKIIYTKPKLVPGVDFLVSLSIGLGKRNPNNDNLIKEQLPTLRPDNTPAAADDTYEAIYGSTTFPHFLSADFHVYYRGIGGGVSYHRINYTSHNQFSGVEIATSPNSNTLADRVTNDPAWSFSNYAHTYQYEYSLIGNAYSLEFHLRREFLTSRVNLLYGIGYLFQDAVLRYQLTSVDEDNSIAKQVDTKLSSHGFLMRFEINFSYNYFLVRTGLLILNNNFTSPTIENLPLDIPKYIFGPYVSLGVKF